MPFLPLDNFYKYAGYALSNPAPRQCPTLQTLLLSETTPEFMTLLEQRSPIYFGTVTIDPSKYGYMSRSDQIDLITDKMKLYILTMGKSDTILWTMEFHKDHRPHIHMLSTGYVKNFKDTFKSLGSRNSHKESYQKTINPLLVFKYLCKFDPIYATLSGTKTIHMIKTNIKEDIVLIDFVVEYKRHKDPLLGYVYYPICSWLPANEDDAIEGVSTNLEEDFVEIPTN